jgi:hypothetical protein
MSRRSALILLAVIACAVGVNALVATAARHAGASAAFSPLQLPAYGAFTGAGVIAGWFGWRIVLRRSARPRGVLMVLVPVAILLSFIPDLALLTLKFIPDSSATAVAALMVMHVVVVALAVPGYLLAAPLNAPDAGAVPSRQPVGTA